MIVELKNGKKIMLETSWDDGCRYDTRIAAMLKDHGLPGVFYIPTATRQLTDWEIEQLARDFEIGGHTETHHVLRLLIDNEAREEITACKVDLERIAQKPVISFCYPKGKYSKENVQMVRDAGYQNARTVDVGCVHGPADPFQKHTSIHVWRRREYQGRYWFDVASELLDRACDPDSDADYFHLWGHGWEIQNTEQWQALDYFMDLLQEKLA